MLGIKESILIVDDRKDIRELIMMMFEDMECVECFVAEDGKQALEILEQFPIHVIVTDIKMPEVSGVELCQQARDKGFDGSIVVITGEASGSDYRRLCQLRIENVFLKPVDLYQLKIKLRDLLHNEILKFIEEEAIKFVAKNVGLEGNYDELSITEKIKLLLPLIEDAS